MQKSDAIALRDTVLWLGLMCLSACLAIALWPTWWSAPFWLVYGVLYGSASDSRWHECGHQTAFKTVWMNTFVYHIASFMIMRNPIVWRASHVRHHTDTIVLGRDPEIVAMRPPDLLRIALLFISVSDIFSSFKRIITHACGKIDPEEAMYVSPKDHHKFSISLEFGSQFTHQSSCFRFSLVDTALNARWTSTYFWIMALHYDGTFAAPRPCRKCL